MLPGASGFLEAIPCKQLDLAWDPCEFLVELRTRLLVNVYEEEECTYNLSLEYYLLHNYNMIGMANSTAAA